MAKTLKVALAQLNMVWENKLANQRLCQQTVAEAARQKAELVVFPEMTLTGFSMNTKITGESAKHSQTVKFFKNLAKQYRIALVFGVVFKESKIKAHNAAVVINKNGQVLVRYDKMHPFSFSGEQKKFTGGKSLGLFRLKGIAIAVVICYDLRFPGLFEALAKHKPEIILAIANWPNKRSVHWDALLRARALDNQSYVVGVNRVGVGDGLAYSGGSAVYSPRAEQVLRLSNKACVGYAILKSQEVQRWRSAFSLLRDKKPKVYRHL